MTKKYLAKKEVEDAVAEQNRTPDKDACPYCGTKFYNSTLSRNSHYQIYPIHLLGGKPEVQAQEAATQDLVPRIKKAKTK